MNKFQDLDTEQRLHPLTIFYKFIISLPQLLIILYFTVIRGDIAQLINILILVLWALLAFPFIFLNYYFFTFSINPKEITIRSGVLSRRQRIIPIEKIQNVEITQNFLQRLLSLAKVTIETAGESGIEADFEFVSKDYAEHIRETIKNYKNQSILQNQQIYDTLAQQELAEASSIAKPIFAMSVRECIIYGALRFRPILFAIVIWLIGTAQQFYILPEYWEMDFKDISSFFDNINEFELIALIAALIIVSSILSILLDILLTINQYYGFKLYQEVGKLQAEHGLLSKRKFTIPLKKLQMVVMRSNFIMRKFELWGLLLETAGFQEAQKSSKTAIPLAQKETITNLLDKILSLNFEYQFLPVSRKTIRRAMVRYAFIFIAIVLPMCFISIQFLWLFILSPILYFGAVITYKHRGYMIYPDKLQIKQGYFFQKISIVPVHKIQSVHITESFFQRRLGLATLQIDTAASQLIGDATIIDLDKQTAFQLAEEILNHFQNRRKQKNN